MLQTFKCSSSGGPVHAIYGAHPAIDQTASMDIRKKCYKTACISLPEVEHLDVRNMSKTL
jgi:hypothetical protein